MKRGRRRAAGSGGCQLKLTGQVRDSYSRSVDLPGKPVPIV